MLHLVYECSARGEARCGMDPEDDLGKLIAKPEMEFVVKECVRLAAAPTECTWQRLKRVARLLVVDRGRVITFKWQPLQSVFKVKADTDDAGCPRTRRPTTCVVVQHGAHFLAELSATQPSPTLSSEPYISAQSMCRTPAAMALRMAATSAGLTSVFGTPVR